MSLNYVENSIKNRVNSDELLDSCPYIVKTSKISDAPILEPVARVVRSDLKAFEIVLSLLIPPLYSF